MIIKKKGDLLALAKQGEFDVIVHGCNCQNAMGSGIARSIREQFPDAWDADQRTVRGDYNKLGNYSEADVVIDGGYIQVINAYTQFGFNSGGMKSDVFEYVSFAMILKKLEHFHGGSRFGFPMIGMGLAGGNVEIITDMLVRFAKRVYMGGGSVTLVEFSR